MPIVGQHKGGPDTEGPLSREDWDFRSVPNDELIACCLWEYARESESIGFAAEFNNRDRDTKLIERAEAQGFNHEEFLRRYWDCDVGFIEIYGILRQFVSPNAMPWLKLPDDARKQVSQKVGDTSIFQPLVPALVGELEKLWNANNTELLQMRAKSLPPSDDSEDSVLYNESLPLDIPRKESDLHPDRLSIALTIDFSRFSDAEIQTAFRNWLLKHRPKHWKKPRRNFPTSRRRGRKDSEYTVALERLGLIKLLHWYSPESLKRDFPDVWKRYGHKRGAFRGEIRAAGRFFKKVFPFLPAHEAPHNSKRLGIWLPQLGKISDVVFREHSKGDQ